MSSAPRPPSRVNVTWREKHVFESGRPGGPTATIDGEGVVGQSPPDAILSALATCTSVDVVDILAKRRTPVQSLAVEVMGTRAEREPRRFTHIVLRFTVGGAGIAREDVELAIRLSLEKYCSVRASLREDIAVDFEVVIA